MIFAWGCMKLLHGIWHGVYLGRGFEASVSDNLVHSDFAYITVWKGMVHVYMNTFSLIGCASISFPKYKSSYFLNVELEFEGIHGTQPYYIAE